jgi:hypothetical protein
MKKLFFFSFFFLASVFFVQPAAAQTFAPVYETGTAQASNGAVGSPASSDWWGSTNLPSLIYPTIGWAYHSTSTMTVCEVGLPISRGYDTTSTTDLISFNFYHTTSSRPNLLDTYPNEVATPPILYEASLIPQDVTIPLDLVYIQLPFCIAMLPENYYVITASVTGSATTTLNHRYFHSASDASNGYVNRGNSVEANEIDPVTGFTWSLNNTGFFVLNGSYTLSVPYYYIPPLPASSSSITLVCPDFGIFTPVCDGLVWAFAPSMSYIGQSASTTRANFATKIPWGWWSQVVDGFGSVSSTDSQTSTAFTIQIPAFIGQATSSISIFDFTDIQTYIPATLLALLRTIGGIALWALFGAWVWHLVTGNKPEDHGEI